MSFGPVSFHCLFMGQVCSIRRLPVPDGKSPEGGKKRCLESWSPGRKEPRFSGE